jgi:hypothetical protein
VRLGPAVAAPRHRAPPRYRPPDSGSRKPDSSAGSRQSSAKPAGFLASLTSATIIEIRADTPGNATPNRVRTVLWPPSAATSDPARWSRPPAVTATPSSSWDTAVTAAPRRTGVRNLASIAAATWVCSMPTWYGNGVGRSV